MILESQDTVLMRSSHVVLDRVDVASTRAIQDEAGCG
jgi:hypothetical protein